MKTTFTSLTLFLLLSAFSITNKTNTGSFSDKDIKFVELSYGIYKAKIIEDNGMSGLSLSKQTDTIPCKQGVYFGTKFRVEANRNKDISIDFNWKFPSKMNKPQANSDMTQTGGHHILSTNSESVFMYGLDKEYELLPGPWVLTVSYKGKVLYTKTFVLVK